MTVTYVGDLSTDLDCVRFYLGDMVASSGPRPSDANFTDAELNGLITLEGSWQKAVAAGFERLAAEWRRYPSFSADGLSLSRSDIANGFQEQAREWRAKYGSTVSTVTSNALTRVDGYSDDIAADEV